MKKKDPLKKYKLSERMRQVLFHAESGTEGYVTKFNHDLVAARYLSYQHHMTIRALRARRLIKKTVKNRDDPWTLSKNGRRVGRLLVRETCKQQALP